jgi:hypothetical protein
MRGVGQALLLEDTDTETGDVVAEVVAEIEGLDGTEIIFTGNLHGWDTVFAKQLLIRYCSGAIFRSRMSDIELKQPKFLFSSEFCDSLTGTKETRCSRNQFQCQHHLQSQIICYIVVLKVLKKRF